MISIRGKGAAGWLLGTRKGATALEFAILAIPFTAFLLFLFEVGFDFYLQEAVDYAALVGARSVQVGTQTATSAAAFTKRNICPAVVGLLDCSALSVNVMPVWPDYYTQAIPRVPLTNGVLDTTGYTFNAGQPDQLMLLQVLYTSPSFVGLLIPSWSVAMPPPHGLAHVTLSSIGFINERRR